MEPISLEGETLAEKHRHYNTLLAKAINDSYTQELEPLNYNDDDILNLLKIDVACSRRNISYILEVLKGEDLCYVSRALKRCRWLVTNQEYSHLINPQYLDNHLLPHMSTKAVKLFTLHIRKHLKNETRVEEFYTYLNKTDQIAALKWLPNCSFDFKLKAVETRTDVPTHFFKRIRNKSPDFVVKYIKMSIEKQKFPEDVGRLLAKCRPDTYLNLLNHLYTWNCNIPAWGSSLTQSMLYKCPNRIVEGFGHYVQFIHIPTFVKYLKNEKDVEEFMYSTAYGKQLWFYFDYLKDLLDEVPRENTTKLLKKMYGIHNKNKNTLRDIYYSIDEFHLPAFKWYQFAPYKHAKKGLLTLIAGETSTEERHSMILVLLACARKDLTYIHDVLKYFIDKHMNIPTKYKRKFVKALNEQIDTHNFDQNTWDLLNNIYRSMDVYSQSNTKDQDCFKNIILYKVLHDEDIPEIIKEKFEFDTFIHYKKKINSTNHNKIFLYLYNEIMNKLTKLNLVHDFEAIITLLEKLWKLLIDWKREDEYFEQIIDKIKALYAIRHEVPSSINLSRLYNMLGDRRHTLFDLSVSLSTNEDTCLNALKHNLKLLKTNHVELTALFTSKNASLRRLHNKLRIYYSHSLAQEWVDIYFSRINDSTTEHRAIIKGLFRLLPSHKLMAFIEKYAPEQTKIQWDNADEIQLNICRHIAKYMYIARPPVSADVVLLYAKGDYLQYAQFSLNSIYYNLKRVNVHGHVQKLLTAPASIQKQGIRLAFNSLQLSELKVIFPNAWNSTRNCSIRTVLFSSTFKLLCKETDEEQIKEIWTILKSFIENLNQDDNKIIFGTLGRILQVPFCVRPDFYMASIALLKSLPDRANCETVLQDLLKNGPELMEYLDSEFVANIMLKNSTDKLLQSNEEYLHILSTYLIFSKDEDTQLQKYTNIVAPILLSITTHQTVRSFLDGWLRVLCHYIPTYTFEKKLVIPFKMFTEINNVYQENFNLPEHYVAKTTWKLSVLFLGILDNLGKDSNSDYTWKSIQLKAAAEFGIICSLQLSEDIDIFFPSIYMMFANACQNLFNNFKLSGDAQIQTIKTLLNKDSMQSYLLAILLLDRDHYRYILYEQVCKEILAHPSMVVKMLYHHKGNRSLKTIVYID